MDFNLMKNNKVNISGEVVSELKFSHSIYNEGFYEFDLKVEVDKENPWSFIYSFE